MLEMATKGDVMANASIGGLLEMATKGDAIALLFLTAALLSGAISNETLNLPAGLMLMHALPPVSFVWLSLSDRPTADTGKNIRARVAIPTCAFSI